MAFRAVTIFQMADSNCHLPIASCWFSFSPLGGKENHLSVNEAKRKGDQGKSG